MSSRAPAIDTDLCWLFNQAAGAVSGLGSQLSGLIDLAQTGACRAVAGSQGIPRKVQGITERQSDAVDKERRLRERLVQIPLPQRDILYLAYGPQEWGLHAGERRSLGSWPGVALMTPTARKTFDRELARRGKEADAKKCKLATAAAEQWERAQSDAAQKNFELMLASGPDAPTPASVEARLVPARTDQHLDRVAAFARRGLGEWLRSPSLKPKELETIRDKAAELVAVAHRAWMATAASAESVSAPRAAPPRYHAPIRPLHAFGAPRGV